MLLGLKQLGLRGVIRGKLVRTTIPDVAAPPLLDRVNRQFKADWPNQLWVSDFADVSTWQGWLFVVDVFARRIVGWQRWNDRLNPTSMSVFAMASGSPRRG
ncbi:hypothetical protein WI89_22105 [Burkholderia ubonensis]|nr:hypothetical protein WI89_22105 [Burkholderia ubonensis]KWC12805.1 hypothetical protein WL46_05055 [Burkholderia ubonensis]